MDIRTFKLLRSVFAFVFVIACALYSSLTYAAQPIVIAQAIDLSGPDGAIGRDYVAGIKTYFDAVNTAGGINGRRVRYIVRDDQGQPELSARIVSEFLDKDQAEAIIGGIGDETALAVVGSESFKRSGQILFAPLANGQESDQHILYWRPSYEQELQHIFEHFGRIGQKQVGIVVQDGGANQQALARMNAAIKRQGLTVTAIAHVGRNGERAADEARKMAASKPGFVVTIADTIGTGLFLKEFRKYDARTFLAGTSLTNLGTLSELAGVKAVEWTVFSQVVPNPTGSASLIQMEHLTNMRKYRDETVSSLTLEGYAVGKALGKAIAQSRKGQRLALRETFSQGNVDLGGLQIVYDGKSNRLSGHIEMALFRKGSELVF